MPAGDGRRSRASPVRGARVLPRLAAPPAPNRIRIVSGVLLVPFRNPVRLPEDITTVDVIFGGRFELGVGVRRKSDRRVSLRLASVSLQLAGRPVRAFRSSTKITRQPGL
jgi:alkanesulfonate monooxygenase SsuD/methylene tetrahydromethanopterin reductase-like flavin-dependent oxidoreductase (luciferase family)